MSSEASPGILTHLLLKSSPEDELLEVVPTLVAESQSEVSSGPFRCKSGRRLPSCNHSPKNVPEWGLRKQPPTGRTLSDLRHWGRECLGGVLCWGSSPFLSAWSWPKVKSRGRGDRGPVPERLSSGAHPGNFPESGRPASACCQFSTLPPGGLMVGLPGLARPGAPRVETAQM